jgi:membrane protein implicated in regulation of membrane protease activity
METVYLVAFFLGLGFAVLSGLLSGVFGGDAGDLDAGGADLDIGGDGGFDIEGTTVDVQAGADIHFPLVSPVTISTFIASFGGMGVIGMKVLEWPAILHIPVAAGAGLGVALVVFYLFYKIFGRTRVSSAPTTDSLIGLDAQVLVTIPKGGAGKISYSSSGTRFTAPARSQDDTEIPQGASVKIEKIDGVTFFVKKV